MQKKKSYNIPIFSRLKQTNKKVYLQFDWRVVYPLSKHQDFCVEPIYMYVQFNHLIPFWGKNTSLQSISVINFTAWELASFPVTPETPVRVLALPHLVQYRLEQWLETESYTSWMKIKCGCVYVLRLLFYLMRNKIIFPLFNSEEIFWNLKQTKKQWPGNKERKTLSSQHLSYLLL